MDSYEVLRTIHVLAAVTWVGGALATQVYAIRAQRANDPAQMVAFSRDAEWVGMRVFFPAAIVVLAAGIGMILEGELEATGLWLLLAYGVFAFSILVGSLFLGPESGRISKLMDERGAADTEVQQRISRIFLVSRIELVLLLLIVVDMVVKPGV